MDRDALYRMLYMRREYTTLTESMDELQGFIFFPSKVTSAADDEWKGMIFIRAMKSPWRGGAFSFTVTFPPKYPFECPTAKFDMPLLSIPLLVDGVRVPFEHEFTMFDPMHVSVMLRLLKCIRRLFVPEEWKVIDQRGERRGSSLVDRRAVLHDLEYRSVSQEILLETPYVEQLTVETREWIKRHYSEGCSTHDALRDDDDAIEACSDEQRRDGRFAQWFTRAFLPSSREAGKVAGR